MVNFGRQGLTIAAAAAVSAAVKGQGAISERLRSFSIPDLTQIPSEQSAFSNPSRRRALQPSNPNAVHSEPYTQAGEGHEEETDGVFSEDEASVQKGLRRSQSVKLTRAKAARKEPRYGSLKLKPRRRQLVTSSTFDHP
ncbi:receptor expression-enhancing protein [Pimephales promelas]|nr:receptor expression-enhancing protein [Pimephales promelas]